MRLSEPIEKQGFFWLPDDAENKLPGILRISDSGEITLELSYFGEPRFYASNKRCLGIAPDGLGGPLNGSENRINRIVGIIDNDLITLDKCLYGNWTKNLFGVGVSTATIHATRAFIGVNYDEGEEIAFSTLTFSMEGLDEWLSISGIQIEYNWTEKGGLKTASIHLDPPKEIEFNLPEGIELKFAFSGTLPSFVSTNFTEASITQKAYISLKSKKLRSLEYFLDLVFKLHNFLCFAIDKTVSIDSVTGYSKEITQEIEYGKTREIPIKIYDQSEPNFETKPKVSRHNMLFGYDNVADQLEEILIKWLENYEISKPAFNLYFAARSGGHKYLDGKFLSLAQGIETLHRRNSQETQMPEDEFRNLIDTILNAVPDDGQRRWIDEKLKYANELSLRKRMKQMIEPFKGLFGNSQRRNSFISKVVDTRNYLTHYDSSLENKAAGVEDLWKLCLKLEALFQLHFLRLIGIDDNAIKSMVNENFALRNKLELEYQNPSE